jgi:hypothetical protein
MKGQKKSGSGLGEFRRMSRKDKARVAWFAVSLYVLTAVGSHPLWADALIVANFGLAALAIRKVAWEEDDADWRD